VSTRSSRKGPAMLRCNGSSGTDRPALHTSAAEGAAIGRIPSVD
jgi:hypothetical protein